MPFNPIQRRDIHVLSQTEERFCKRIHQVPPRTPGVCVPALALVPRSAVVVRVTRHRDIAPGFKAGVQHRLVLGIGRPGQLLGPFLTFLHETLYMPKNPANHGKPWSNSDNSTLKQLAKENTPTRVVGLKMGRTPDAVYSHANELGVSLKPTNQSPYNKKK